MRNIGTLPTEEDAQRFSDALYVRSMENDVEAEDDGSWSIWVHDDSQLEAARTLLTEYRANPQAEFFVKSAAEANRARAKAEKEERKRGSNVITRERLEYERNYRAFAWLPLLLIIGSVAVALQSGTILSSRPNGYDWLRWLHIAFPFPIDHSWENLRQVRSGEVWRLFTPMLIHYGAMHLLFNMMWLSDLGGLIQNRHGALYLAALILVVEGMSSLAQYFVSGAAFGGMSGVNYGLFGFLWIRAKFDRTAPELKPIIVQTMIIWFFICLSGLLGPVANTAHFVGLVVGGVWGYLSAQLSSRRR